MKIKKYLIIIISIIVIGLSVILLIMQNKTHTEDLEEVVIEQPIEQEIEEKKKNRIDIKGEVNKPGVYELDEGKRVFDAIEKAGGLTENADTTLLNLSKNLTDEMVIIIYNKNEIEKLRNELSTTQTVIKYIEKECTCPDTINDACIAKAEKKENKKTTATPNNKVSINTGTLEELMTIPGIGESKAQAIIEYRTQNGSFETIEDIKNISGIGDATYDRLKEYITV